MLYPRFANQWREYYPTHPGHASYSDWIDGFDHLHSIHVYDTGTEYAMVYHNEIEPEGSAYYWGVYCSGGDGGCDGDLEEAKRIGLMLLENEAKRIGID